MLVGFAGGGADALALFTRLEAKLEEFSGNLERAVVELAKDWRTDRALRQLQAMMIVSRPRARASSSPATASCCSPTRTACSPSARAPTSRWPRRAPCCGTPTLPAGEIVARGDEDRRRDLHLHQRPPDRRGALSRHGLTQLSGDAAAAARAREPDAAADRRRARQVRRRPERRPSGRWRSPCATAGAASSCRPSWPRTSRPRTS